MTIYKVKGYKPVIGNKVEYVRASSEGSVIRYIKSTPPEEGGFVTYSIEQIEVLPLEVHIDCPNCGHNFESPDRVVSVG